MIFNALTFYNYGPFRGTNKINFSQKSKDASSDKRNIILIGGKNGSGKTTIFTGLQVCLYGQSSLSRISKNKYDTFIRSQVHKTGTLIPITSAFIEVDFDFSIGGKRDNYKVKRMWDTKGRKVDESLEIKRNGILLKEYEQNFWQDFVKHLVPQGLLKLFFFDGERINSLTQNDDNYEFKESIQTLFGVDTLRQLRADLRNIERKSIKGRSVKTIEKELRNSEEEIRNINLDLSKCIEKKAELRTKIDTKNSLVEKEEKKLRDLGGALGLSREKLKVKIAHLSEECEVKYNEIRLLCQGALPLYQAKKYLGFCLNKIDNELEDRRQQDFQKEIEGLWRKKKDKISRLLKCKKDFQELKTLLVPRKKVQRGSVVYDKLSNENINDIKKWFKVDALSQVNCIKLLAKEVEERHRELVDVTKNLEHIPEDSEISIHIEKINTFSREKGFLQGKLQIEELLGKELHNKLSALERDREKLEAKIDSLASDDRKLSLISKTISALQIFEERLIDKKINDLELNILNCFNGLMRKGDVVKRLEIEGNSFDVILEDSLGRKVDKRKLSEGEKQIYAVSVLSGITKTSQKTLPIVFDTPLGRLDSDHRDNIIHNYFPFASHQLILFSTDTEIDKKYFNELKPYLSHSYLLDYDKNEKCTSIKKGYFWG